MRAVATFVLLGATLSACSLVGFDDLVTEPCGAVAGDSIEAIRAGNELCASIEAMRPAAEGTTWVCREPIGEDLFCVESSVDADNDGVGAESQGGLDCDDSDPTVFGGQEESICDGKDNDCDGSVDENLVGVQGESSRVYPGAANLGSFAAGTERMSFIGRRPIEEDVVVVVDGASIESDQTSGTAYAAAPVGTQAIILTRPSTVYELSRTDETDEPTANLAGEDISFPAIGVGETSFLAAWYNDDAAGCGAPAGPVRYTTGFSGRGIDTGPPMDLPDASPIQAPVIIPIGPSEFLVFAANASDVDAHLVTLTEVVSTVSFSFDDTVSAFAVATGETDGDTLTLGLSVVAGCGRRVLEFRELQHALTTGITSLGEVALTEEGGEPPGAPAIRWSGSAPRGFLVTWVTGDSRRTFLARLIVGGEFAGPAFDISAAIPGSTAFPYGAAIAPATGGGLRVWTYAEGPQEGVYEIVLGCGMR